jgi:hypothetical protein
MCLELNNCRYVGEKYAYRSANGSSNNPALPFLGAARTEYARTIRPETIRPPNLPDPGLIFDSLFARENFTPHPNKVSSIFFAWASLIIHGMNNSSQRPQQVIKPVQIYFKQTAKMKISTTLPPTWIYPFCMETLKKSRIRSERSMTAS